MAIRSGMDEVRASIANHVRTNFVPANAGLVTNPTITQNPTRRTGSPVIYFYPVDQTEVDTTKDGVNIEYAINVEVRVRYNSYRGGRRQAEQIVDEIIGSIRGLTASDYPSVNGYTIYRIRFANLIFNKDKVAGADYVQIIVPFLISATQDAVPSQVLPVQAPAFTYTNFTFSPTNNKIERYDSGEIVPTTTYPSGNNGWNFVDASFSVSSGSVGTFTSGNYNVPSGGEPLGLSSSLRYNLDSDSTVTTTLTANTSWDVIDSIRYGAVTPEIVGTAPTFTDDAAATYGLRNLANWNIEYGTVTPHNETITVTGDSGQFVYIIIDEGVTLTQIQNTLGQNVIDQFNVTTVGDYKIYINTQPIVFDGFSTDFTLIA